MEEWIFLKVVVFGSGTEDRSEAGVRKIFFCLVDKVLRSWGRVRPKLLRGNEFPNFVRHH
jgi:hypothetical protein